MKSLLITFILLSCSTSTFANPILILGRQDLDPKAGEKDFGNLMKSLELVSGLKTQLRVRRFPSQLRDDIASGEVNMLIDTVYNLVALDPNAAMIPTLNIWKKGTEWHQGCIGTLEKSTENGTQFKGKRIVMEEPYSTGSYAQPMDLILATGVTLSEINIVTTETLNKSGAKNLFDAAKNYSAPKNKVTIFFSGDDEKSPSWLKAGAAEYIGTACKKMSEMTGVKKLVESSKLPRQLVSFHKSLNPVTRDKIVTFMKGLNAESIELKGVKGTKVSELSQDQIASTQKQLKDWKSLFDFTEKVVGK